MTTTRSASPPALGEYDARHDFRATPEPVPAPARSLMIAVELACLGLTLAPASEVGGAGREGVAVTAVDPNGPAAEHGMQTGDVILDVGGKSVSKPDDVRQELAALQKAGKNTVLMRVKSGDSTRFVAVPFGKA